MGWWNSKANGASLQQRDTGLLWGDGPADYMDAALDNIVKLFWSENLRPPTKAELKAGLLFSLGCYDEPTKTQVRKANEMLVRYNDGEATNKDLRDFREQTYYEARG
jgi:hypothetical protein